MPLSLPLLAPYIHTVGNLSCTFPGGLFYRGRPGKGGVGFPMSQQESILRCASGENPESVQVTAVRNGRSPRERPGNFPEPRVGPPHVYAHRWPLEQARNTPTREMTEREFSFLVSFNPHPFPLLPTGFAVCHVEGRIAALLISSSGTERETLLSLPSWYTLRCSACCLL